MENCDNLGFSVETEDLERYIPHISTGMNIEYCDMQFTVLLVTFQVENNQRLIKNQTENVAKCLMPRKSRKILLM